MSHSFLTTVGRLLVVGLYVSSQACSAFAAPPGKGDLVKSNRIAIEINQTATVSGRVIQLGDVATVTGGDVATRNRLKQLDLEDTLESGDCISISPQQIEFRLRLAGFQLDRLLIRGRGVRVSSDSTEVTCVSDSIKQDTTIEMPIAIVKDRRSVDSLPDSLDASPLEKEIIRAGRECILRKLPWPEENVSVRVAQSLPNDFPRGSAVDGYDFSAELRSSGPPVGRVQVRVMGQAPKRPSIDVSFLLDVRHFENVVMAKKSIERGHVLTWYDLYVDRQDVTELSDYCSSTKELIGTTTKRPIRALVPVRMNDVESSNVGEAVLVIKQRDQVKMTAHIGAMDISATGEALQPGRIGEVIRIKNLESNVTVKGKVIGPGEVQIGF